MKSETLSKYKDAQHFWQNLGLNYFEIQKLTCYDYEMFKGIMNIESQYQDKEQRKYQKTLKR